MDTIEFSSNIDAKTLATIFKSFFEQHICAYYLLNGLNFINMNADIDRSSLIYSVKLLEPEHIDYIINMVKKESSKLTYYGKKIIPDVYVNGDILCLSFKI